MFWTCLLVQAGLLRVTTTSHLCSPEGPWAAGKLTTTSESKGPLWLHAAGVGGLVIVFSDDVEKPPSNMMMPENFPEMEVYEDNHHFLRSCLVEMFVSFLRICWIKWKLVDSSLFLYVQASTSESSPGPLPLTFEVWYLTSDGDFRSRKPLFRTTFDFVESHWMVFENSRCLKWRRWRGASSFLMWRRMTFLWTHLFKSFFVVLFVCNDNIPFCRFDYPVMSRCGFICTWDRSTTWKELIIAFQTKALVQAWHFDVTSGSVCHSTRKAMVL